jgi:hypothetical protein
MVHKPAGAPIAPDLLRAAISLNRDGWGLMGFAPGGRLLLERHAELDEETLLDTVRRHEAAEYVLHLRQRTHGVVTEVLRPLAQRHRALFAAPQPQERGFEAQRLDFA